MSDPWSTPGGPSGSDEPDATPPAPPPPGTPPPAGTPPPPAVPAGAGQPPTSPSRRDDHVASIPLRPMGLGELLDAVFTLLRRVAVPAAVAVLLVMGPIQVLASVGAADSLNVLEQLQDPEAFAAQNPDPFAASGLNAFSMLGLVLSVLAGSWISPALVWLALRSDDDPPPGVGAVLGRGFGWFPRLFGATVLLSLGIFVPVGVVVGVVVALAAATGPALLVLLLPIGLLAIVALAGWFVLNSLLPAIVVIEDRGVTDAIRRSWSLWRARFWPLLGYLVVGAIVVQLLAGALSFPFTVPALLGVPGAAVLVAVGGIVSTLVATPITTYYALAVYFDTRIRTEGYDVAVQARRLS